MHFDHLENVAQTRHPIPVFPEWNLLVAGLTRGGTQFTSHVLRRLGVSTGHEAVFGTDGPRELVPFFRKQHITVEVSGLAAPFCDLVHVPVVHLLRHPVRCIQSNIAFFRLYDKWERLCQVYLDWHRMIEKVAVHTVHLERFRAECGELIRLASPNPEPSRSAVDMAIEVADHGARKYTPAPYGWDDLPKELQEYARTHGYGP